MNKNAYPPLYRPRPKRHDWRNWIIAIAATIAIAGAMALTYDAESAAWRKAQHTLVIAGQRPGDYWSTWANLRQCEAELRER